VVRLVRNEERRS